MTDKTTLSGEEISALMSEAPGASGGGSSAGGARAFPFGGEGGRPMSALPALDRMSERMAKKLRGLVEPFARAKPRVVAEPAYVRNYGDWQAEQAEFVSLSLYALKPLKGAILLAIEPAFISRLVDARYGGTGDIPPTRAREFTATEESLLARLSEQVIEALAAVWTEIVPVKPGLRARETNVAFAALVRPDEPVAVTRFTITPWPGKDAQIEIVYPVSALRSIEQELLRSHDDAPPPAGEWRDRLAAAVGEIRFPARTVLARPELTFSELMQLQVGDVIPVTLPSLVPLLVEGRRIAVGTIGEHDGRAALRVERMETRRSAS
jgi:flagellar motor switch protein FliM